MDHEQQHDPSHRLPKVEQQQKFLEKELSDVKGDVESLRSEMRTGFRDLTSLIESRATSNIQSRQSWWGILAAVMGTAGSLLWLLINTNMQSTVGPIKSLGEYNSVTINQIVNDIKKLQERNATLNSEYVASEASRKAKEVEIETQFDAQSQIYNMAMAQQQRVDAAIWNATGKLGEYPRYPVFFPNVSRKAGVPATE